MPLATTNAPITRGKLAKRFGCHLETLRYYEKIGLLLPPDRSVGGHRLYKTEDQRRLRFIHCAVGVGAGVVFGQTFRLPVDGGGAVIAGAGVKSWFFKGIFGYLGHGSLFVGESFWENCSALLWKNQTAT